MTLRCARAALFRLAGVALLLADVAAAQPAEPGPGGREAAAAAYDRGSVLYERADYSPAAEAFLQADALVPSTDAVHGALLAARKSGEWLLVVRVARRAIALESAEAKLAAEGRQALLDATRHLAVLELRCKPEPCSLLLDGGPVEPGVHYLLPGTHLASARHAQLEATDEQLRLDAGARYRIVVQLRPKDAPPAAHISSQQHAALPARPAAEPPGSRTWSPTPVYVGAAATVLLAGLTTWSGIDTLRARDDLPDEPRASQIDRVEGKILRSNILFGSTLVVGAATAYAAFALVDWSPRVAVGVSERERSAVVHWAGHF